MVDEDSWYLVTPTAGGYSDGLHTTFLRYHQAADKCMDRRVESIIGCPSTGVKLRLQFPDLDSLEAQVLNPASIEPEPGNRARAVTLEPHDQAVGRNGKDISTDGLQVGLQLAVGAHQ